MPYYGIIISASILAGILFIENILPKDKKDHVWKAAPYIIISSVVAARIYHIFSELSFYLANPLQMIMVQKGGLAIAGAVAGGILGMWIYARKAKEPLMYWLDTISIFLPIGQAIGRWGNYLNHELYGLPTRSSYGQYIPPEYRLAGFEQYNNFHPIFLYESVCNIVLFSYLFFWLHRKNRIKIGNGVYFYSYLLFYSLIRFVIEFLRINSWAIFGINVMQGICAIIIIFSVYKLKHLYNKK